MRDILALSLCLQEREASADQPRVYHSYGELSVSSSSRCPRTPQQFPLRTKTDMDFSAHRADFSGSQHQGQLSRLTDRTRLRRLKDTRLSHGPWQQVTRIENLCHTQVSHKWLHILDACAGSVVTPQLCITNVQRRLGNRLWICGGHCRCCAFFLDSQLEHAGRCSTAELVGSLTELHLSALNFSPLQEWSCSSKSSLVKKPAVSMTFVSAVLWSVTLESARVCKPISWRQRRILQSI